MMKDKFLERYFKSKNATPTNIKKDYEEKVNANNEPGIHVIVDSQGRYCAVCNGGETQTTYLINEYDELQADDFPAKTTEYSYEDSNGNFINVEEHAYVGDKEEVTYSGFTMHKDGKVDTFSAEDAKNNYATTHSAIEKIFEAQQTAHVPTEG